MENLEEKIEEFLRKNEPDLIRACEEGKPLVIDFGKLDRFNPLIADRLIESPEEIIGMFERAIDNIDLPEHEKIRVRIKNLPKHRSIRIRDLRAKHLNKLYEIVGIVRSASEIRPQIYEAVFKCPECGNMITVEQNGPVLRTPLVCECGRRGIFKLVETKKYDIRWLNVNEPYEITSGEQPGKIDILLKEDLTTPEMQRKTDPGNQLRITGILKEIPKRIAGKLSTRPGIFFEANYVEPKEEEFEEMKITEEDKKKIEEMAKDPYIYDRLVASIAPGIYGLSEIKEAILLQLFGGIKHEFEDGTYVRGNIHILLTGDPSTAKSVLISNVVKTLPRGRYVSGKGVTGAGLTSTVTKNELLGGWILEAGALILSNKSILAIDEFDKMNRDDMIAMHEAMSLESYHKDTVITLANGEQRKIGNMVEEIFRKNKDKIRKGADCFYIDIKDGPAVLTTDFKNIYKKTVFRVSKHKAPEYFYKVILENGKEMVVTPNHPCFCFENGRFAEKPVNELRRNDFVPIPRIMPITGEEQKLNLTLDKSGDIIHNSKMKESEIRVQRYNAKHIQIPMHNSPELCRWIGYMVSEGSHELNRGKINGISFTNSDQYLLNDFRSITKKLFGLSPYIQKKEGRTMLRYISVELKNFVSSLEPALLKNSYLKRLPPFVFKCRTDEIRHLLRALFDGDGSLVTEKNSMYITYTTTSKELANQIYDLLLRFGIVSRIVSVEKASKRRIYRVVITGSENLSNFLLIGFSNANKNKKISKFLGSKLHRTTYAEKIPVGKNMANVLRLLKLPQKQIVGYNITYHERGEFNFSRDKVKEILNKIDKRIAEISEARKIMESADSIKKIRDLRIKLNVSTIDMAKCMGCCHQLISLREIHRPTREFFEKYKKAFKRYLDGIIRKAEDELCDIRKLVFGDIALCKIRRVEKIKNRKEKWVYDISVPNKIFLSNGMVLHNTISVAKASIVATLPAETAILAAANPKLGRFDTYAPIIDQVMIPETLLSRFDLKFALRDIPDREKDAEMVDHVTKTRLSPEVAKPLIDLHMLRKYISYARKTCTDIKLTEEAANMLKKFYVDLRNKYAGEATPTVTITLRQFEALIRLAEASAKVRMDKYVRKEDAERAIKLMTFSIQQLGTEIETGKIDIDRMESGITSSQRSKIKIILDIMSELESKIGKNIPIEDVKAAAEEQGIENADEMLEKLDREGLIFHPKPGHVRKA